ncbi:MAG: hypothetical protein HYV26_11810 [Candidatus Hydrogenedentes bacterium]|nr:hypothetical protein [Candidatus Hydrogenedentota bacterium]
MLIDAHVPEVFHILAYSVLGVAAPVLILAYYARSRVRRFYESADPEPSWFDRYPLLSVVEIVLLTFTTFGLAFAALYDWVIPVGSVVLSGWHGALVVAPCLLVLLLLIWGLIRKSAWAAWGTVVLSSLFLASSVFAVANVEWGDIWAAGLSDEQRAGDYVGSQLVNFPPLVGLGSGFYMPLLAAIGSVPFVLHFLWRTVGRRL